MNLMMSSGYYIDIYDKSNDDDVIIILDEYLGTDDGDIASCLGRPNERLDDIFASLVIKARNKTKGTRKFRSDVLRIAIQDVIHEELDFYDFRVIVRKDSEFGEDD